METRSRHSLVANNRDWLSIRNGTSAASNAASSSGSSVRVGTSTATSAYARRAYPLAPGRLERRRARLVTAGLHPPALRPHPPGQRGELGGLAGAQLAEADRRLRHCAPQPGDRDRDLGVGGAERVQGGVGDLEPAPVVLDQLAERRVDPLDDAGAGPEALGQLEHVLAELFHDPPVELDVRSPEPVDRLLRVADDEHRTRARGDVVPAQRHVRLLRDPADAEREVDLQRIRVLELVEQERPETSRERLPNPVVVAEQVARDDQEVVEGDAALVPPRLRPAGDGVDERREHVRDRGLRHRCDRRSARVVGQRARLDRALLAVVAPASLLPVGAGELRPLAEHRDGLELVVAQPDQAGAELGELLEVEEHPVRRVGARRPQRDGGVERLQERLEVECGHGQARDAVARGPVVVVGQDPGDLAVPAGLHPERTEGQERGRQRRVLEELVQRPLPPVLERDRLLDGVEHLEAGG